MYTRIGRIVTISVNSWTMARWHISHVVTEGLPNRTSGGQLLPTLNYAQNKPSAWYVMDMVRIGMSKDAGWCRVCILMRHYLLSKYPFMRIWVAGQVDQVWRIEPEKRETWELERSRGKAVYWRNWSQTQWEDHTETEPPRPGLSADSTCGTHSSALLPGGCSLLAQKTQKKAGTYSGGRWENLVPKNDTSLLILFSLFWTPLGPLKLFLLPLCNTCHKH